MPNSPKKVVRYKRANTKVVDRKAKRPPPSERGYGDRWQRIARVVRQRDGYLCQACGRPGNEVDHIIHKDVRPDLHYDTRNLQVLCKPCHARKSAHEQKCFRDGRVP